MRAVLDTVIFVRALINPGGMWGRLLFEYSDRYVIVISPPIIQEILEVARRPELSRRFRAYPQPPINHILALFEQAEVVVPKRRRRVCRDPGDDKFFECAIEGRAAYIVSEDRDILDIGEYEGVKAVSAAGFIAALESR